MGYYSHKKNYLFRNLNFPNSLPGKSGRSCISNLMIKVPSIKLPTAIKIPTMNILVYKSMTFIDLEINVKVYKE